MKLLLILWQLAWKTLASLIILLAVLAAAGKLLLPQIGHYRPQLEQWLGQRLKQTVRIGNLTGEWHGPWPELHLQQFRILNEDGEPLLNIGQLDVVLSPQSLFTSNSRFIQFVLRNASVEMRRLPDGSLQLSMDGVGTGTKKQSSLAQDNQLTDLGSLRLVDSRLVVHWSSESFPLVFERVNALYTSSDKKIWVGANLVPLGVSEPVEISLRHIRKSGRTDLFVQTRQLELLPWVPPLIQQWTRLRSGRLNLQLWLTLQDLKLQEAWGRASLEHLGLEAPQPIVLDAQRKVSPRYWSSRLSANLHYLKQGTRHDLRILQFSSEGENGIQNQGRARFLWQNQQLNLALEHLPLDQTDQLLRSTALAQVLEHWLPYESSPEGFLDSARLQIDLTTGLPGAAEIRLRELAMIPAGKYPGFTGLNAQLHLKEKQWHYTLQGQSFSLDYPHMFRDTLHFSTLNLEGQITQDAAGWNLHMEPATLINPDLQLQARMFLHWPTGARRPFIDMQADLRNVQAASSWKYWPANVFKPKLLHWLDQALLDGQANATMILHGDLNQFPFRNQEGRFDFLANVEDLHLRYHPQWPVGHIRQAEVEFDRMSMHILQLEGEVDGLQVQQAEGGIRDYRHALLNLNLNGSGTAAHARQLLDDSPLHKLYARHDDKFSLQGQVRTRMQLKVPLSPHAPQKHTTVDGRLSLDEGRLELPDWQIDFQQLEGDLRFDETGFSSQRLHGQTLNRFVDVELCVAGHCKGGKDQLRATLRGQFPMETMIRQARVADTLIPFMPGESQWEVKVNLPKNGLSHLQASSNLVGVTSLLPAPLDKLPDESVPMQVELDLPPEQGFLDLRFAQRMHMRIAQPGKANRCLIVLGPSEAKQPLEELPEESIELIGKVKKLDLSGWMAIHKELFGGKSGKGSPWLKKVDIQTGQLDVLQHHMGQTRMQLGQDNGFWKARFDGERIRGEIQASILPGPDDTLIADFERIYWPRPDTDKLEELGKEARQHGIRVSEIPRLHLLAQDFRLGQLDLGEVRLEAYPIADGLRVERVQARGKQLTLNASGDWLEEGNRTRSQFQIHLGVESVGKLLARMGYADLIKGGQTVANLDANWPGPPTAFALEKLDGNLELEVGPGEIVDVKPGAGRIFGLLSLQQLPRRLLLDFRDIFNRGLSFDKISGHFQLKDGIATTDDLEMNSRTAQILISGKTDLANQQYDQTIVVIPNVGQALPMVGALTGGVAGAAAMLAVQGLIGKSLDESSGVVYRLTGSWSEPNFQRLNLKSSDKAQNSETPLPAQQAKDSPANGGT